MAVIVEGKRSWAAPTMCYLRAKVFLPDCAKVATHNLYARVADVSGPFAPYSVRARLAAASLELLFDSRSSQVVDISSVCAELEVALPTLGLRGLLEVFETQAFRGAIEEVAHAKGVILHTTYEALHMSVYYHADGADALPIRANDHLHVRRTPK